jgi:hypothetical protein
MKDDYPRIDNADLPTPGEGFVVTMFITVRSIARSRARGVGTVGQATGSCADASPPNDPRSRWLPVRREPVAVKRRRGLPERM